jgi:DNA-binding GntR family transcriptional regulator
MQLHSSTAAATSPRPAHRLAELVRKLEFDIELARLPPGELISSAAIARRIRCHPQDIGQVLAEAERRGLLARLGDSCRITDVDRERMLPLLARRRELELLVAERAARRIAPLDEEELADASVLMTRSALLGDIEGFMEAGRRLDHACAAAADLPEAGAEIRAIKAEFRRAWCAYNRLRDINEPAAIRREIAEAVLARRPDAARECVEAYFRYLRRAF